MLQFFIFLYISSFVTPTKVVIYKFVHYLITKRQDGCGVDWSVFSELQNLTVHMPFN